jgi:putative hydrolase of the HAD superfamily
VTHRRFTLITFDLDDTLWDVRPVLVRAERRVREWIGERCPALLQRFDTESLMRLRLELLRTRPELRHQISSLRIEAMRIALAGAGYDEPLASRLAREAFEVFLAARHEVELFEAVEECLERLGRDYTLGVLTNGNADVFRLELGRHFRFALRAEQLNVSKPDPGHFRAALRAARTSPEKMIHVGDHHEHDILGAQRLGIATIWVNRDGRAWPEAAEPPCARVSHFQELPAAITELESASGKRGRVPRSESV